MSKAREYKSQTKNDEHRNKQFNKDVVSGMKKETNKIWDFFCSVKLAIVIILIMAIACVLGTVIIQGRSFDEYVARYGSGLANFFRITQLNNVFYSYWFSFLLLLLCANLICCTIRRWKNTFLQTGFVLTHLSLVLILVGGVVKFQMGVKGGVNVYEGKSVDYFLTQEMDSRGNIDYVKNKLPFTIALDDFILEKNEPTYQLVTYVKDKDKQKVFDVDVSKRLRIPGSDYRITVTDYIPDAKLTRETINVSENPDNPAVLVTLYGSEQPVAEGWLLAKENNYYDDKQNDLRIEYKWLPTQEAFEKAVHKVKQSDAKLSVRISNQGIFQDFAIEPNKTLRIKGADYSIRILQYVLNYGDKRPVSEQPAENPAVQVEINGPEGSEMRWVFENFPDWDKMHPAKYDKVKLTCSGIASAYMARNVIRIYHAPGEGNRKVVYIKDGQIVESKPWEVEKKCTLEKIDQDIMISKYYPSFNVKQEVVKSSDQLGRPAVFIEIEGPRGKMGEWVFSQSRYPTWYKDRNFALLYESTGESVKHYISNLRIIDNNEIVEEKSIKVNDPLKYKGYVIYQSSYDPEGGRYSGLQIVKDPGIPIAYAGFASLCFGVVFIFYIKPFLRKKQNKK